jgi:heme exporter protein A
MVFGPTTDEEIGDQVKCSGEGQCMNQDQPAPKNGIVVSDAARRYGPRWVLGGINLSVLAGEALLLIGENGSGKTTLLRAIATAIQLHHGSITIHGQDAWRARSKLRSEVSLLTHASRLYEDLSASDNLRVWARLGGFEVDVEAALTRVGLPVNRTSPVRTFSDGMRRRVALARLLLRTPSVILFDEPFAALDPAGRTLIGEIISEMKSNGATVIVASHLIRTASLSCDHAVSLDEGRVNWRGSIAEAVERFA